MVHSVAAMFSSADLERIQAAVKDAESKTSGEIVPYVVAHSDVYEEAEWRCGSLCGVFMLAGFALIQRFTWIWLPLDSLGMVAAAFVAGAAGMTIARYVSTVKRFFAGGHLLERRVGLRAAEAFITEEVFKTRDRTGILIFVSLFERKVLVLGDTGINSKVQKVDWESILSTVVEGIRSGKQVEGLIEAIRKSGALLEKHGFAIRPDDRDELPDALRMSDS